MQPIEGDLLNGSVIYVGGAGPAKPNNLSGVHRIRSVGGEVASEIVCCVINGERLFGGHSPFETSRARAGMHHRKTDVSTGWGLATPQLPSRSPSVGSAAVAPKVAC